MLLAILLTPIGIIVGIIATILANRYYFQRTVRAGQKALTPYRYFSSSVLEGIDLEVRQDLNIRYQDVEVADLYHTQFVIANTGERAVRDCIEPLSLVLPENIRLLDASVTYVYPEGRKVEIHVRSGADGGTNVELDFPLLNKGEYFIVKLLTREKLPEDLVFKITVDDLPPTLKIEPLPFESIAGSSEAGEKKAMFVAGIVTIVISVVMIIGLVQLGDMQPHLFFVPLGEFWGKFSWASFTVITGWFLSFVLGVLGVLATIASVFGELPRRPLFRLPEEKHPWVHLMWPR